VGRTQFNANVRLVFNLPRLPVRDVYGFTEQLGIVYPDDGEGVRLTPTYSEVLVRDPFTFKPVPDGQPGLLQFISPLPHSYPGIAVLLDDIGRIVSRDSHEGGRCGTRFEVLGRAKGAEIRGCGDTMPDRVYEVRV
jgi:phenylacetate-coenzyme A ligase PaaK-like adenylate-forming protein